MDNPIPAILLRDVIDSDLDYFFQFQLDPDANYMAAFTAEDPKDRQAFDLHWARILNAPEIIIKTILVEGQVVGNLVKFEDFGEPEIGYWLDKAYWGRGIATQALTEFLRDISLRPLFARAVKDNLASRRVLEKCGFMLIGTDKSYANGRGMDVEEVIMKLED